MTAFLSDTEPLLRGLFGSRKECTLHALQRLLSSHFTHPCVRDINPLNIFVVITVAIYWRGSVRTLTFKRTTNECRVVSPVKCTPVNDDATEYITVLVGTCAPTS